MTLNVTDGCTLVAQDNFHDVLRVDTVTLTGFAPGKRFSITEVFDFTQDRGTFPFAPQGDVGATIITDPSRAVEPLRAGSLGLVRRSAVTRDRNMEILKVARTQSPEAQKAGARTEVEVAEVLGPPARAMAQAERVFREISVVTPCTHSESHCRSAPSRIGASLVK